MCCSAKLSNKLRYLSDKDLNEHFTILKEWGLPTKIPKKILIKDIISKLESMGKLTNNQMNIILLKRIGLPMKTKGIVGNIVKRGDLNNCMEGCY